MGLITRAGCIVAILVSREVNRYRAGTACRARLPLSWLCTEARSIHGDGAPVPLELADLETESRQFLMKRVDSSIVCQPSSKSVKVLAFKNDVCLDLELKSQIGFRALSFGDELMQRTEGRSILPEIKKSMGCSRFEIGHETEVKFSSLECDMEQRTGCAHSEMAECPNALACGEEIMQGSNGGLAPSSDCGPNVLKMGIVQDNVDINEKRSAEYDPMGNVIYMGWKGKADEVDVGSSETSASSNKSTGRSYDETKDATLTDQTVTVQNDEVSVPLENLPSNCGHLGADFQYPVPLSPMSGELAKSIEYERAMVAEAAMKSGPTITKCGILFEDEWLMVINKPCGMYCEHVLATVPTLLTPIVLQATESSLSRLTLRRRVDGKDTSVLHLHMANRLDRDTSGVMVITKCKNAAGKLSNIFMKRQVQKSYIALCRGPPPSWKSLTVDSGHGRSRYGAWRVYSKKDVGRALPGGSVVRDMTTHLLVMAINKRSVPDDEVADSTILDKVKDIEYLVTAGDETSSSILRQGTCERLNKCSENSLNDNQLFPENDEIVIRALPVTGRTHQIRLHCQFVGLPLRGDVKYGGPHCLNGVRYDHHALHAESLSFIHPFTFEQLKFVAPLPEWASDAGVQPLVL